MSDIKAQFSVLKQTADPAVADAIVRLIEVSRSCANREAAAQERVGGTSIVFT